jgi:RNA-directed DNA polymerase
MENQDDLENVIGFDALYKSMYQCKNNVLWKGSVASYFLNGIERTIRLEDQLKKGAYKAGKPVTFKIKSPKERDILSIPFRDRVYQRSLNDNEIYPEMSRSYIYDNCACQIGKGPDLARNRLKEFLHKVYRHYVSKGIYCSVLQIDIHGYYPNMQHSVAEKTFAERLRPAVYKRAERVLREQYSGEVGYNPGSQMVQIVGVSVPDKLDHYIKEKLKIKFYIRYMDDFILVHESEEYLSWCKDHIQKKLAEMSFEFNNKKTRVYPLSDGIMFLGFTFSLSDTGKVVMILDPDNVKEERKRLYRQVRRVKKGEMPKSYVDDSFRTWKSYAKRGNSHKLIQRMNRYYSDLWKEVA